MHIRSNSNFLVTLLAHYWEREKIIFPLAFALLFTVFYSTHSAGSPGGPGGHEDNTQSDSNSSSVLAPNRSNTEIHDDPNQPTEQTNITQTMTQHGAQNTSPSTHTSNLPRIHEDICPTIVIRGSSRTTSGRKGTDRTSGFSCPTIQRLSNFDDSQAASTTTRSIEHDMRGSNAFENTMTRRQSSARGALKQRRMHASLHLKERRAVSSSCVDNSTQIELAMPHGDQTRESPVSYNAKTDHCLRHEDQPSPTLIPIAESALADCTRTLLDSNLNELVRNNWQLTNVSTIEAILLMYAQLLVTSAKNINELVDLASKGNALAAEELKWMHIEGNPIFVTLNPTKQDQWMRALMSNRSYDIYVKRVTKLHHRVFKELKKTSNKSKKYAANMYLLGEYCDDGKLVSFPNHFESLRYHRKAIPPGYTPSMIAAAFILNTKYVGDQDRATEANELWLSAEKNIFHLPENFTYADYTADLKLVLSLYHTLESAEYARVGHQYL